MRRTESKGQSGRFPETAAGGDELFGARIALSVVADLAQALEVALNATGAPHL